MSVAILLPNTKILLQVVQSPALGFGQKVEFLIGMYGLLGTNFSLFSAVTTVATAVLFGINIALLIFYVRRRQSVNKNKTGNSASVAGVVAGVFGVGCAACGSVLIASFLALFGAGGLLLILPLHGAEFGILSVCLLLFSVHEVTKRINDPLICPT